MTSVPADHLSPTDLLLLYHFCRLQLPAVRLSPTACEQHLHRTFDLYRTKVDANAKWSMYLKNLHHRDWFVACACMDGNGRAWDDLFAARAGRSDCLLTDALRARAARLYPRNDERQESAVQEFWGHLYVSETADGLPVLARYDGQRPLVPWLIRVFQNWHVSQLRRQGNIRGLPEDDIAQEEQWARIARRMSLLPDEVILPSELEELLEKDRIDNGSDVAVPLPTEAHSRWHETFAQAAREVLAELSDQELLILGLRLRYRLSQREVAGLLKLHEGTVSRKTDALRDHCLERIGQRLLAEGWTGDDLSAFVHTEMYNLLLDDPRLSVDHLAHLMSVQGKKLPQP